MGNIHYEGSAPDIQQVTTITVGGSWLTSETSTVQCGAVALTFTVGSDTATSDIAEIIARMINGDSLKNDESRTNVGSDYGEWMGIEATYSGSVVTLTAERDSFGDSEPFTVTQDTTGSVSGLLTLATPTASKGRYHADDTANWNGGVLPTTNDDAILEGAGKHIRFGLQSINDAGLIHYATFDGDLGLPFINRRFSKPYADYRVRALGVEGPTCELNAGSGPGSRLIRIDRGGTSNGVVVHKTGSQAGDEVPVQLMGSAAATYEIRGGTVGIDYRDDEDSSLSTTIIMTKGKLIAPSNGTGVTALTIESGDAYVYAPIVTLTINGPKAIVTAEGTITTFNGNNGILDYRGTTITNATIVKGRIDLTNNTKASVTGPTVIEVEAPGEPVRDPKNLLGAYSLDCNHVNVADVKLNVGLNKRITIANVA